MTDRRIRILPRAVTDLDTIIGWTHARSPQGAASLIAAFEKAQLGLKRSPEAYSQAPESEALGIDLRQVFFRTRRGNTYRMIVLLSLDEIQNLRIRGPGQPPLAADEITGERRHDESEVNNRDTPE